MNFEETLHHVLDACKLAGASDADARISRAEGESVNIRDGKLEQIERNEDMGLALRCFFGRRQASASGSDLSKDGLNRLVERCISMAKLAPEDPYAGLADEQLVSTDNPVFDLSGDTDHSVDLLTSDALEAEAAALQVSGVKQVSDCGAGWTRAERWLAASNGFSSHKESGMSSIGLAVIAERDGAMERDYASRSSRRKSDRLSPTDIGLLAAQRTLKRLGPTKIESQLAPVIYDKRVSTSLLNAFINAISGPAIARGVSFLKEHLGAKIFSDDINIIDDPFREYGHGTRGHDGEGLAVKKTKLIDNGQLNQWL